jgi:hypothetical protein
MEHDLPPHGNPEADWLVAELEHRSLMEKVAQMSDLPRILEFRDLAKD